MPPFAINLILILGGGLVGAFVNWGIYNFAFRKRRNISPWNSPGEEASERKWHDFIPCLGWWFLKRDDEIHGKNHWIRPLLIELACMIGAVWLYHWQMADGLVAGKATAAIATKMTWFSGHAMLITLMLIATFIDFDERTIPDWITIPGTVFALLFAAFWPEFRLPEVVNNPNVLNAKAVQHINFHSSSPSPMPTWQHDWRGLISVLGVLAGWAFVLLPPAPYLFRFMWKSFRLRGMKFLPMTCAFMLQPPRKTECKIRVEQRESMVPYLMTMGTIFILLAGLTLYLFYQPSRLIWNSFFGSVFGLAVGGGTVWAVRIVGGHAMGREAMGFGDVTLMAMIGAFLGWQASLLTFAFAPFAALFIALAQVIATRKTEIAFGPYLCLAALFCIIAWYHVWEWASKTFFSLGINLFYILFGGLVMLGLMLTVIQWFKGDVEWEDEAPAKT